MILILGGRAQGQLDYALKKTDGSAKVIDGMQDISLEVFPEGLYILNNVNEFVYKMLKQGHDFEAPLQAFLDSHADAVIISDEVGNGIVPMDSFERGYREIIGRMQIALAAKADRVVRVVCGTEQILK